MKQLHIVLVAFLFLIAGSASIADEMVFEPTKDAVTYSSSPDWNLGLQDWLAVGSDWDASEYRTYIQFDVSQLPDGVEIDQVDLELYVNFGVSDFELDAYYADVPWEEATINWNNQPPLGGLISSWSGDASTGTTIAFPIDPSAVYYWQYYPDAQGMGLHQYDANTQDIVYFDSREHTSGLGPKLRVVYHVNPPAGMTLTPDAITLDFDYGDPGIGDYDPDATYLVQSTGPGILHYVSSRDVDWMSHWPPVGDLDPGESDEVEIEIEFWPGPGTHIGHIVYTDSNAVPPVDSVTVTLNCHQAQLAVDPAAVDLFWSSYDPEVSVDFEVQNPGDLDLNWTLAESADWMVCSPTSGTVAPGSSETVTVTTDTWPGMGTYSDFVTITAADADPNEVEVEVTLVCTDSPAQLTLYPPSDPVLIAPGAGFEYDAQLQSYLDFPVDVDVWTQVLLPNGNTMNIWRIDDVSIAPNSTILVEDFSQWIPAYAPAGDYVFYMRGGYYPNYVAVEDEFGITVQGSAIDGGADNWLAGGYDKFPTGSVSEAMLAGSDDLALPDEFSLGAAYPNPFNPSTTLRVNLPEAVELNVSVYNVTGQLVATLANGSYEAGSHALTFDASHLSGGVYFVQAAAGSWNDVQKVVLMK